MVSSARPLLPSLTRLTGLAAVLAAGLLGGCAMTPDGPATAGDPIEGYNRGAFAFNQGVDEVVIAPVAEAYDAVLPDGVQRSVRNLITHIESPIDLGNEILQGDAEGAVLVLQRFFLNTTLGIGGLFDAAEGQGYARQPEDFGQTLAVWGVGDGPYLVVPLIGPSTARDLAGRVVDSVTHPLSFAGGVVGGQAFRAGYTAVNVVDGRAAAGPGIEELRQSSSDFYAAVRSAYRQRRDALIADQTNGTVQPLEGFDAQ